MVRKARTCDLIADLQKKIAKRASSSAAPAAPEVSEVPEASGDVGVRREGSSAELPAEPVPISVVPSEVVPPVPVQASSAVAAEVQPTGPRLKKRARKEPAPEEVGRRSADEDAGGSVPEHEGASRADKGKKAGERSAVDVALRRLELEVARRRGDMISGALVEQVDQSPVNLHECIKVHALLTAHLVTCAQKRATQTNRALEDLTARGESIISAAREEARRSVVAAEERAEAAVAEKLSLELDLNGKLAEARKVVESLDAENRSLKGELQFVSESRERISKSLADANARIDSLYTYDRAVQVYRDSDDFVGELDSAGAEVLEELHANYSAGVRRMFPEADMVEFLEVVREEAEEAAKRREEKGKQAELEEATPEPPVMASSSGDKAGPSRRPEDPPEP